MAASSPATSRVENGVAATRRARTPAVVAAAEDALLPTKQQRALDAWVATTAPAADAIPVFSSSSSSFSSSSSSSDEDNDDDSEAAVAVWSSDEDDSGAEGGQSQNGSPDNRELVHFLQTLQSVAFDKLPYASVPPSMAQHAELKPFQLQALHWMRSREGRDAAPAVRKVGKVEAGEASGGEAWFETPPAREGDAMEGPSLPQEASGDGARGMTSQIRGGIFADYMGLGKTRSLIALCESSRWPCSNRVTGSLIESAATLIVCPTPLLMQWAGEIRHCLRPATPRILIYHGSQRKRRASLFDIAQGYRYVITTYQTLCHERAPHLSSRRAEVEEFGGDGTRPRRGISPVDDVNTFDIDAHLQTEMGKLYMIRWARIILDEAHYIRNARTRQSQACLKLCGVNKWAVTATPVQNSLNDLFPLLRFLEVPHFSSLRWWNEEIVRYFNIDPHHRRPVTALAILFKSILLRRTPDSVVDGKPILELPSKHVITRTVALSREETQYYKEVFGKARTKINALRDGDTGSAGATAAGLRAHLTTFSTAFEMLVRCRQTCLHPYIVVAALRRCGRLPMHQATASADQQDGSGCVAKDAAVQNTHLQQALDAFISGTLLRRLKAGKTSSFVAELIEELRAQQLEHRECIICLDAVHQPSILPCAHVFCRQCIQNAIEATKRCPLCKRQSRLSELLSVPMELLGSASATAAVSTAKTAAPSDANDVGPPPAVPEDVDLTNLGNWKAHLSSKTQYLVDSILKLPVDDKVVVFSSFLTYLQYAQHRLQEMGVNSLLYSGSLTIRQKEALLARFRGEGAASDEKASPRVLLATIASCGVGLNLTCANHCFLMEPSWNPGTEEQALNRIHRIGQSKPVHVVKLIADNTIEQNINALCDRKRALSGYCFTDQAGGPAGGGDGRLRTADLLALFAPERPTPSSSIFSSDSEEDDTDEYSTE